ncbi:acyltransferase family protein [Janibacter sp. GS2]|uniref:acyltransferase family protein n=1 Tax=Janibacter sp. GS2 TaxID=3442646 RepID=UPI003EB9E4FC
MLTEGLPERRFRPELHGLRGLAILLVALFHIFGQGRVSGGLDVFLVVSGFLFTGMLLREAATTGRIAVIPYLGRLARRLLPAMVTVVAVTTVLGLIVLPESRRIALLREGAASTLYVENWELIHSQLAYEAAGSETSVFQHIWSLSVQGQFYLLWPLLTVGAVMVARRMGIRARHVMIAVAVLVIALSFPYAVYMHHADQANAYLNTGTRLWQLAVGALIALLGSEVLPRRVRPVTGWIGVALIVSCGFFLDGGALFPGPWAWWPVLGFALVMWSEHPTRWGASRVLCLPPFAWIGDISYAFYLWHWPLLVLWLTYRGSERVDLVEAVGILVVSLALAQLTVRGVERPTTKGLGARPAIAVGVGAALVAVVAAPAALGANALQRDVERQLARQQQLTAAASEDSPLGTPSEPLVLDNPGGRVLDPRSWVEAKPGAALIPDLAVLEQDQPAYYDEPCRQEGIGPGTDEVLVCDDPDRPEGSPGWQEMPVVVITGGSHAGQWVPAFRELGRQHGWRILVVDKSGCQLTSNHGQYPTPRDVAPRTTCAGWNSAVVDTLEGLDPDLVVTIATTSLGAPESTSLGFLDQWAEVRARDIPLVTLRDSPRIREPLSECLSREDDPRACDTPMTGGVGWGLAKASPFLELEETPDVGYIDLSDYYCPDGTCPAIVGNVVVYRDKSHLSAAYVRTLAAPLSHQLREQAPQLYE